jgi:periplasmic protein TonB
MPSFSWILRGLRSANPYRRLAAAVCLSALLHGVLLLGFRVGQIERPGDVSHRLQVRLADVEQPVAHEEKPRVLLRALDTPAARTLPEPQPQPVPPPPVVEPQQTKPSDAKPGMTEQAAGATTLDIPLPEDSNYYPARQVDEHPSLVSGGKPVYPEKAGRDNVKGEVTALILLNEHGAADEVSIVDAKPTGAGFEEAVILWLRDARFKPAMRKGRAVKARVVYHVTFDYEEGSSDTPKGGKR